MNFSDLRIFLCTTPTSMTYSFDRLMGLAQQTFEQDPLSGHLFLFLNRERDRIKILFWDRDGFCIWYKKLESHCPHFSLFTEFGGDTENPGDRLAAAVGMDSDSTRNGPRRRPMSREIAVIAPPRAQFWDSP
jgi:transposase